RAAEVGPTRAAELLGIPVDTIKSWQRRDSANRHRTLVRAGVTDPDILDAAMAWPEREERIAGPLGQVVGECLDACAPSIRNGQAGPARSYALAFAVLVDKSRLIAGASTSRAENFNANASVTPHWKPVDPEADRELVERLDAEIAELRRELEEGEP